MKKWYCLFLALILVCFADFYITKAQTENANHTGELTESGSGTEGSMDNPGEFNPVMPEPEENVMIDDPFFSGNEQLLAVNPEADPSEYAGIYDIYKIDAAENAVSEVDMRKLRQSGYECYMFFAEDGTGVMQIATESNEFTYDYADGVAYVGNSKVLLHFLEDGELVVVDGSDTMYLRKRQY